MKENIIKRESQDELGRMERKRFRDSRKDTSWLDEAMKEIYEEAKELADWYRVEYSN